MWDIEETLDVIEAKNVYEDYTQLQFLNPEYKHVNRTTCVAEHYMHVCIWPCKVLNGKNMQGHAVNGKHCKMRASLSPPSEVHGVLIQGMKAKRSFGDDVSNE